MTRVVEQSYLDKNYDLSRSWTAIPLSVTTPGCELEMKYSKKKLELRLQGRTEDELLDRPLFACCDKYEDVVTVSATGLRCGMNFLNSCLGQLRHADADVDDDVADVSNKRHHY